MSIPVIAFFNNKSGVGKTTLVHHLSWALSDLGRTVLAADLDPQANLTASFLNDNQLEELWQEDSGKKTIYGCVEDLIRGIGDISRSTFTFNIDSHLHLLAGDLNLARFEDELSYQWPRCLEKQERAFRVSSAFGRILQRGAKKVGAGIILIDLGPNLGAINRAALISVDYLVIPLTPDFFSLQGLKNVGSTVRKWQDEWDERLDKNPDKSLKLPRGNIEPLGYVMMQHAVRFDRPVQACERWIARIPEVYVEEVHGKPFNESNRTIGKSDPNRIGLVKHYPSLMPMAMEANKPMFHLQPADGAIGAHYHAVREAGKNFEILAREIEKRYLFFMGQVK